MKLRHILLIMTCCLFGCLWAEDTEHDKAMWRCAYNGEYSLTHKLVLTRDVSSISDAILSQFALAYLHYRMNDHEEIVNIFKGIDKYIELIVLPNKKKED